MYFSLVSVWYPSPFLFQIANTLEGGAQCASTCPSNFGEKTSPGSYHGGKRIFESIRGPGRIELREVKPQAVFYSVFSNMMSGERLDDKTGHWDGPRRVGTGGEECGDARIPGYVLLPVQASAALTEKGGRADTMTREKVGRAISGKGWRAGSSQYSV